MKIMSCARFVFWTTSFFCGAFSSQVFAGPMISGGEASLPIITCQSALPNGNMGRSFAVYPDGFNSGNPATDRYKGIYVNREVVPAIFETLICHKDGNSALLWHCNEAAAQQGPRRVQVTSDASGLVKMLYFRHDPVEVLGGPDDVLGCVRLK